MSFVPFQMNRPEGVDGLVSGMTQGRNIFLDLARQRREEEIRSAENLRNAGRQDRQDFQSALMDAHKAAQAGDMKLAQSIMAPYGAQMQQRAVDEGPDWAPKLNQGEIDFADQLPMNRPGGPAPGQGPQAPPGPVDAVSSPTTGSPESIDQLMQQAAPLPPQQQAPNKLVALAQADQAKRQRMAQFLTGKFNGQDWTLDPEAGRQESLQQADKAFYDASGEDTPEANQIREQYPQLRATYAAAGQDINPKEVFAQFRADAAGKRQEDAATERERMRLEAEARRNAEWDRRFPLLEQGRDRRAAQFASGGGLKVDAGNRQDAASLERAVKDIYTAAGGKQQLQAINSLHAAYGNINATGPNTALAHKDALIQLAKYFRGNVPTEGEMKLLYDNIGGVFGSVDAFEKRLQSGDISGPLMANLTKSAQVALGEAEHKRGQLFEGMKARLGPGSEFGTMGPQVNQQVRAYGKLFGLDDVPAVYDERGGNPGAVLGTGKRPTGLSKPASPSARKSPADWFQEYKGGQ